MAGQAVPVYLVLQIVYDVTLLAVCLYAFRRGGPSEQLGAAIILIGSLATIVVGSLPHFNWHHARAGLVIVDLVVLLCFYALAMRSERFWPLWATAFHLIAVSMHALSWAIPLVMIKAYILMQGWWAYPMLAAIAVGTRRTRHPPASRRQGEESTPPSPPTMRTDGESRER
jgi:hypothetical protein